MQPSTDGGTTVYKQYGKLHREDGPAIILSDDTGYWYVNGRHITTDGDFQRAGGLSDDDMLVMILKYGHVS